MPPEARITLVLEDGDWTATDEETGLTGSGDTRAAALDRLDERLADEAVDVDFSEGFDREFDEDGS